MFEALFILTTIDTGTRIAPLSCCRKRWGRVYASVRADRLGCRGAALSTVVVTARLGLCWWRPGSIDTIWPMFGIANSAARRGWRWGAGDDLADETQAGAAYALVTILPMLFVTATDDADGGGGDGERGRFLPGMIASGVDLGGDQGDAEPGDDGLRRRLRADPDAAGGRPLGCW